MTTTPTNADTVAQQAMKGVLASFLSTLGADAQTGENSLLEPAIDKIIAANGNPAVAGQALAGVAVMAPLTVPTLIAPAILAGAVAAKSILGIANTWLAARVAAKVAAL